MGQDYKEEGGGAATGLADQLIKFLSQGMNTGTYGAGTAAGGDAAGSTVGVAGVLNDILSGGAGNVGGSMAQLIRNDTNDQVNNLRARYGASGGTAFGTGAQYGEGVLRSKQAPAMTTAIGNLQMNAVQQIMNLMGNLAGKGISQRQGMVQENPWLTGGKVAADVGGKIAMAAAAMNRTPTDNTGMQLGPTPGIQYTPPGQAPMGPIDSSMMPQFAPPQYIMTAPTLFDYGIQ